MAEAKVPLSVVTHLIETQREFNKALVEKLGLYLERASENYKDALNPPLNPGNDVEMSYSRLDEAAEDLQYQIEAGIIPSDQITDQMRRILADTDVSIDLS